MKKKLFTFVTVLMLMTLVIPAIPGQSASAASEVLYHFDFESGTDGWGTMGEHVVIESSTEAAQSGKASLKVSNRNSDWNGPALNGTDIFQQGGTYTVSAYVKLAAAPSSSSLTKITMKETKNGVDDYNNLAEVNISNAQWHKLDLEYAMSESFDELTMYVETQAASASFFIDNVTISMTKAPPGGWIDPAPAAPEPEPEPAPEPEPEPAPEPEPVPEPEPEPEAPAAPIVPRNVLSNNFDDGEAQGWVPNGGAEIEVSEDESQSGDYSLLVTGRNAGYEGPSLNITDQLTFGETYLITGYVKLKEGEEESNFHFVAQETNSDGLDDWTWVGGDTAVTHEDGWVEVGGLYTMAEEFDNILLYLESDHESNLYYLDDFSIMAVKEPGEDGIIITKTFEDIQTSWDWALHPIEAMASKGIINGTSETTFRPADNIRRGDYIKLLINTLDLSVEFDANYEDILSAQYYYEEIGIAKALGITASVEGDEFDANTPITRQDMMEYTAKALIAAEKLSADEVEGALDDYTDTDLIADYALDSISLLVANEIIEGSNNKINPLGNTRRAEAATLIYRLYILE